MIIRKGLYRCVAPVLIAGSIAVLTVPTFRYHREMFLYKPEDPVQNSAVRMTTNLGTKIRIPDRYQDFFEDEIPDSEK